MTFSSPDVPSAKPRILCVEDDQDIALMLNDVLKENGFETFFVTSGTEMDVILRRERVDLVLLDVMLPGEDGVSICRRLRHGSAMPIIMVTARGEESDRILGFETGADDYVAKPFSSGELVARIRAVLRRSETAAEPARTRPLTFAGWRIDPAARELSDLEGTRIALTSAEFDLLLAFCRHPGEVLSRERLIELIHGGAVGSLDRSIDVHISRIRQKIETDSRTPTIIKTVRLGGYLFTPPVEPA
ncbi:MAG: putative two-component response transcriptional regulator [Tardiphaga sp.]|nr:putative two-component response transcriptional regulator [Tardiphaga sp.]